MITCLSHIVFLDSCQNAFTKTAKREGGKWDIVINLAGETKFGQTDEIYRDGIMKLSMNCANLARQMNVKRYVEISSGCMNSSEKIPLMEDSSIETWTFIAKYKALVEEELKKMDDLNYTIFRLPIVYGMGDRRGLTPRIIIAALYKYLNEPMKLLWNEKMMMNTIHVTDVVAGMWELIRNPKTNKEIINLVDDSQTSQGLITDLLCDIFNIKSDYFGITLSNATKLDLAGAVEEINDKHLSPWAELCQKDDVMNTPLTPFMDEELLLHKHLNLSNDKMKSFGYQLRVPKLTKQSLEEIINDFMEMNLFPRSLKM